MPNTDACFTSLLVNRNIMIGDKNLIDEVTGKLSSQFAGTGGVEGSLTMESLKDDIPEIADLMETVYGPDEVGIDDGLVTRVATLEQLVTELQAEINALKQPDEQPPQ